MASSDNTPTRLAPPRRRARASLLTLLGALAIVLASTFGATVVTVVTAPRAHAATVCQKFKIIGVRGSGETSTSQPYGMGSTVGWAADSATKYLMSLGYTSADVGLLTINYDAISVDTWLPLYLETGDTKYLIDYLNSVQTGIDALEQNLTTVVSSCPGMRLILIGYSQGAEVVHKVIDGIGGANPLPTVQRNAIAGVLLFADTMGDDSAYYAHLVNPTTGADEGPGSGHGVFGSDTINAPLAHRTIAICFDNDDLICNSPDAAYSNHINYDTCCSGGVDLTDYWGKAVARFVAPAGTSSTGAVNDRTNKTRMLVRGTDNLDHETYLPDGTTSWHAFTAGTGPSGTTVASDPVVVVDHYNVIRVFVRGANGYLYERYHTVTAGWSGWISLGSSITGQPHAVVDAGNVVRVYVRRTGTSGHVFEVYLLDGGSTWHWYDTGLVPASDAVPLVDYDGIVRVYAIDTAHDLVERYLRPGGTWSIWNTLVGGGNLIGNPVPIVDPRNVVRVYVRNTANHILEVHLVPRQTWGVYDLSPDSGSSSLIVTTGYNPVAIADHDDIIRVYASYGSQLWERHLTPGSSWSTWYDMGGNIKKPIGAIQDLYDNLYVFVHNADNSFGQDTLHVGQSWSGIVTRSGVTLA